MSRLAATPRIHPRRCCGRWNKLSPRIGKHGTPPAHPIAIRGIQGRPGKPERKSVAYSDRSKSELPLVGNCKQLAAGDKSTWVSPREQKVNLPSRKADPHQNCDGWDGGYLTLRGDGWRDRGRCGPCGGYEYGWRRYERATTNARRFHGAGVWAIAQAASSPSSSSSSSAASHPASACFGRQKWFAAAAAPGTTATRTEGCCCSAGYHAGAQRGGSTTDCLCSPQKKSRCGL